MLHSPDGTSHQGSITCVDAHRDNVLVATGSEDSTVKVVNTNSGKARIWNIFMLLMYLLYVYTRHTCLDSKVKSTSTARVLILYSVFW